MTFEDNGTVCGSGLLICELWTWRVVTGFDNSSGPKPILTSPGLGILIVLRIARLVAQHIPPPVRRAPKQQATQDLAKPLWRDGHRERGVSRVQKHHELEEARRSAGRLAVVQIPKEVPKKALLALVRLGREVYIHNQVLDVARVLEAVIPPRLDRRLGLRAGRGGEGRKRLRGQAAVEIAPAGLHLEELVLVDVVVEGGLDDGRPVGLGRRRQAVRHDVLGARRGKGDGRAAVLVHDGVLGRAVGPRRVGRSEEREHGGRAGRRFNCNTGDGRRVWACCKLAAWPGRQELERTEHTYI